jgi:hypothetical protein
MMRGKISIMMPIMIHSTPRAGPPNGNPNVNQDILHLLI